VFATQRVDPEHPALGATVAKIAAVAARVDEVVVLADGAVPGSLPDNVTVRTFGARSRLGRGAGFPLPSHKVVATGHGIDVRRFRCGRVASGKEVARPRPLLAGQRAGDDRLRGGRGPEAELDVYGPTLTDEERRHRGGVEQLVEDVGAGARVRLRDAVPRSEVPQLLTAADALVNNMRAGAPDKVVYEAAASSLPCSRRIRSSTRCCGPSCGSSATTRRARRADPGAAGARPRHRHGAAAAGGSGALGRPLAERVLAAASTVS